MEMMNSSIVQPVVVSIVERIDLRTIPLHALGHRTFQLLSALLNKKKIFKSEEGYCRDWRGLFQVLRLENQYVSELENNANPTRRVIDLWQEAAENAKIAPNLMELQEILGKIDRWDVRDSSNKFIYEDAEVFLTQCQRIRSRESDASGNKILDEFRGTDEDIITVDDTYNHKQFYDAFVLFADADVEFATKMIERLEEKQLKICVKDRDFLAGISFEHEAIIRLITERCRRLLVIISKEFLRSPLNEFFVTFTQALQIEQKKRKIIPCVYERLELPANLKFLHVLDYKRSNKLYNFWDKLVDAIKVNVEPTGSHSRTETKSVDCTTEHESNISDAFVAVSKNGLSSSSDLNKLNVSQSNKKSHSSCDISSTSKQNPGYVSSIELTSMPEIGTYEQKKRKWYSKLGLSSESRKMVEVTTSDKHKKNKSKWYKPSKKVATAL
ncbi:myeloid differentiation primary response protein MyD88-like [Malaya genurostris]|uniref:myeloid differentiation primary response protein MyD88-like n=1 Tax=Malaya genurostris TaxID=325434 RepID=UPI0026F38F80|nr:myeloid differentiation primary response protein MyD88-like [Malaya genurostris]XP_058465596.1 myeloid differentiation primary response protein MyD88-like [Malaya genurostris]